MLAIWNWSTGYRVLGLLHVLAVITAFGPVLLYPTLRGTDKIARLHMRMTLPSLTLVWVLGMGLVGTSAKDAAGERLIQMSDGWIVGAIVAWVAAMSVSWFLIRPALTDRSERADKLFHAGIGATHLILVVSLWLMVFKPGTNL